MPSKIPWQNQCLWAPEWSVSMCTVSLIHFFLYIVIFSAERFYVLNDKVNFFSSLQRRGVHGIILCWHCGRDPQPKKCLQVNCWICHWVYLAVVKFPNVLMMWNCAISIISFIHFGVMDIRYTTLISSDWNQYLVKKKMSRFLKYKSLIFVQS